MDAATLIADEQVRLARELESVGAIIAQARLYARNGTVHVVAAPDLGEQEFRDRLMELAAEHDGVLIAVAFEVWFIAFSDGMDPATRARLEAAAAAQKIHLEPEAEECVILFVEAEDSPPRRFDARIFRDGAVRLGPWIEQALRLPRPTFRRYLVERVESKAFIPLGGGIRLVLSRRGGGSN